MLSEQRLLGLDRRFDIHRRLESRNVPLQYTSHDLEPGLPVILSFSLVFNCMEYLLDDLRVQAGPAMKRNSYSKVPLPVNPVAPLRPEKLESGPQAKHARPRSQSSEEA